LVLFIALQSFPDDTAEIANPQTVYDSEQRQLQPRMISARDAGGSRDACYQAAGISHQQTKTVYGSSFHTAHDVLRNIRLVIRSEG
jgi:hypothetical protein